MGKSLKSKIALIVVAAVVVAIGAYMILNANTSYSYEDIADSIQVEAAPNGDVCINALLPMEGTGRSLKVLEIVEIDEVNKIRYYSAVMYVSSTVGAKYFGEKAVSPFCLISENGMKLSTIFLDGQYDENGMPVPIDHSDKTEINGVEYEECVVRLYYAEFSGNGMDGAFKTTPKLIWSRD